MLSILFYCFILLLTYATYKLVIKPYFQLKPYLSQGFCLNFTPFIGIAWDVVVDTKRQKDSLYIMKKIASDPRKYRGMATTMGSRPLLHIYDPVLVKEFLNKQENYVKAEFLYGLFYDLIGNGLFFLEGSRWKTHRKLISMNFHFELLRMMIPEIGKIAQEIFNKRKAGDMKGVLIMDEFQSITGETVGRLFFGEKFCDYYIDGKNLTEYLAHLLARIGLITTQPSHILLGKKFVKAGFFKDHKQMNEDIKVFMKTCLNLISNKMKELEEADAKGIKTEKKNLIQLFYDQRKSTPEEALSDKEILGEFVTFFLAGMDTTGHLVTHATYFLHKHPEHREKLMEEINKYCPSAEKCNIDDLNKMEFTTEFLKEVLRIFNPVPFVFDRIAAVDHQLGDLKIKKGTMVNFNLVGTFHNANVHNDPDSFDPYRFKNPNTMSAQNLAANPFVFTPFSAGPRNCIGQHLAMYEGKLILSLFLKNFEYEFTNKNFEPVKRLRFLYEFDEPIRYDLRKLF